MKSPSNQDPSPLSIQRHKHKNDTTSNNKTGTAHPANTSAGDHDAQSQRHPYPPSHPSHSPTTLTLFLQSLPLTWTPYPHYRPFGLYALGRRRVDFSDIVVRCQSFSQGCPWRCRRPQCKRGLGHCRWQYQRRSPRRMIRSVPIPSLNAHAKPRYEIIHGGSHTATHTATHTVPHTPSSSTRVTNLSHVTPRLANVRSLLSSQSGSLACPRICSRPVVRSLRPRLPHPLKSPRRARQASHAPDHIVPWYTCPYRSHRTGSGDRD